MRTPLFAVIVGASLSLACGSKPDDKETKSNAATSAASPAKSAPAPSADKPPVEAPQKERSPESLAFQMGRKYGWASAWQTMSEVKKGDAEVTKSLDKNMNEAKALAAKLGIDEPPVPKEGVKDYAKVMKAIKDKKGDKASALFAAGARMTDIVMANMLETNDSKARSDVAENLTKGGVPDSVWKEKLAVKGGTEKAGDEIQAHLDK